MIKTLALIGVLLAAGCGYLTEKRLQGAWETEATPKRTLDLRPDKSYSRRFSGKTLGFLSDLAGAEQGSCTSRASSCAFLGRQPGALGEVAIKDLTGSR